MHPGASSQRCTLPGFARGLSLDLAVLPKHGPSAPPSGTMRSSTAPARAAHHGRCPCFAPQRWISSRALSSSNARAGPRRVATMAVNIEQMTQAYKELLAYIKDKSCNPIIVRLAWHDSGTYDANIKTWPERGGANASIRFPPEMGHAANAGLSAAVALLEPLKAKYPDVSYADLFQMASAAAIEAAGGPHIPMQYGRKDAATPAECAKEGNLPGAAHPFADGSASPAQHLRRIFHRMGLTDQEIVALSGAHTLGRARPDRSGHGKASTKYTKDGPGTPGGQSWTPDWLVFNNSYFVEIKAKRDAELLVLPTDACIFEDEGFRPYAELYASDQAKFFADYAAAHKRLSELGVEWVEGAPVTLPA